MPFIFLIIVFVIMVILVNKMNRWSQNNNSPETTVEAVVSEKRDRDSLQQIPNGGDPTGAQGFQLIPEIHRYVVFTVDTGETMEFSVTEGEFRSLQKGERGRLTFQGTRYLGFERIYGENAPADNGEEEET